MRLIGLHLLQTLSLVGTPRPSAVAELDAGGRLVRLEEVADDDEIVRTLPPGPALVAVDAPLAVPNPEGRRDVETLLAWCDIAAFPVSRRRLVQVTGGLRGEDLAPRLRADGREVVETLPDMVLRMALWRRTVPPGGAMLPLAEYRERWLGVRPPAFRAKAQGRARASGLEPAAALLGEVVDLDGWEPPADPDDWAALRAAACLDAIACAAVAWLCTQPGRTVRIGTPERGEMLLPCDPNLRERLQVNLDRMRGEGVLRI